MPDTLPQVATVSRQQHETGHPSVKRRHSSSNGAPKRQRTKQAQTNKPGLTQNTEVKDEGEPTEESSDSCNKMLPLPTSPDSFNTSDPVTEYWVCHEAWPMSTFNKTMARLLAKKKSISSRSKSRKRSGSQRNGTSQSADDENTSLYGNPMYQLLLERHGSFMRPSPLGISESSHNLVARLLKDQQIVPQDTLFDDDRIAKTCANLNSRNEAKVIQDISRLLVPSAEAAAFKHESLGILTETVSARWTFSQPLTQTQPAPDYAVGFRYDAFTRQQSTRMRPFIGNIFVGDESLFLATSFLYFPFLTCEVKGAGGDLQVADRQNAHSATLAVRAIAELFLNIGRADEINREILAFSISHNDSSVQIYGHYPVIAAGEISYFRHLIHMGLFANKTDRWTSYRFTMNVYTSWVPMHWGRLCSAIDQLAEVPSEDNSSSAADSEAL